MKNCKKIVLLGSVVLSLSAKAAERSFYDVITNANGFGLSPAVVCANAAYGSYTDVFDGVTDDYGEHRYMLTNAEQMFFDLAPAWTSHAHLLTTIANKRIAPRRYRLARMTAYEDAGSGTARNINRAPCEWYFYGLTRSQTLYGNPMASWAGDVANHYTNGVQSVLLDHRKDFFWPKNSARPGCSTKEYPYLKDCHWAEFTIDEKFADYDFVGFRLYCVDSTNKRAGETIDFGIGQFEVYVDYEDFSANESDFEVKSDGDAGIGGFSPALGAKPIPGTVCTAPASYVDSEGNTWHRQGWTVQSRIMGWRDTERGWSDTYTIPERDGYLHRLVWNYEMRSPRKASKLFASNGKLILSMGPVRSGTAIYNGTHYHLFDGVLSGSNCRALGYIQQGCKMSLTLTGNALTDHRLVPFGYRVVEADYENSNTAAMGRSPTAWRLYGVREDGAKVLLGEEEGRQSICPMYDQDVAPADAVKLPGGVTGLSGTIYPVKASEDVCREGFVGYEFEPLSSIYSEQGNTGIDFCLSEIEVFVETNSLGEITVASDLAGAGFAPELGAVVTTNATLTPPASIVKDGLAYHCIGYRRYVLSRGTWELVEDSENTSFAYNADQRVSKIVWKWRATDEEAVSLWQHAKDTAGGQVVVKQGGLSHGDQFYGAYRAFDGDYSANITNRWLANIYCGGISLGIEVKGLDGERLVPQSYTVQRSQMSFETSTKRAPSAWVLYGIPDGQEGNTNAWVELDRRSDVYWSDNTWSDKPENPLRGITRSYPITASADLLAAGFSSYRFVPLRSFYYDFGVGYDQTIEQASNINMSLAEITINVTPAGRDAILISSDVEGADGFMPPLGSAFRTAYEGDRIFTAPATLEVDGTRYSSAGYAIETFNDNTRVWEQESAGAETNCAYAWIADGKVRRIRWKWNVEGVRVNAEPENGTESVTYSSGDAQTWRAADSEVTITANGNAAWPTSSFECWTGDVEGIADVSNATITVTADRAKRLKPKFLRNWAANWDATLQKTTITDGNWNFTVSISETVSTDYTIVAYNKGFGDLDLRGKVTKHNGDDRYIRRIGANLSAAPITSIYAPSTLRDFTAYCYQNYSITNLVFDSPSLTNIAARVFARCKNIERVTFGPQTSPDVTLTDEPFLCEYQNQHPKEFVFECERISDASLLEMFKSQYTGSLLVERAIVIRVNRDKAGWRDLVAECRKPSSWELYYTAEQDRKNFKAALEMAFKSNTCRAKLLYKPRGEALGLTIIIK